MPAWSRLIGVAPAPFADLCTPAASRTALSSGALHRPRPPMSAELAFPVLEAPASVDWHWPMPPFQWRDVASAHDAAHPCRIETRFGTEVEGELLRFDADRGTLAFRSGAGASDVTLPFARMRRLVLTTPMRPSPRFAGAPPERVPAAAQEREYTLHPDDGGEPQVGRTAGHVERGEGLYLYTPMDDERSLQRVFVPRSAYSRCEFGPSAEERAAEHWCSTPAQVLAALERQRHAPVLPIGQSMLELGLVTPAQLDRAITAKPPEVPLGEMLVASGILSSGDLQTALAHKMGYPLVDLTRFPIDREAARRLSLRVALECRALPLMLHGERLVVAVDRPARTNKLRTLHGLSGLTLSPVLASRNHIFTALQALAQDIWADNVHGGPASFAATTV